MKNSKQDEINKSASDLAEMNDVLKNLSSLKEQKDQFVAEFEHWTKLNNDLKQQYRARKYENLIMQASEKEKIEDEFRENLKEFKTKAQSDAHNNILEIEKHIHE